MATIYQINQLSFKRGDNLILDQIDFAIEAGEYISIIGPNGAGKSTLIKHLNRILPAEKGTVELQGRCLQEIDQKIIARTVAYVAQRAPRVPHFSVREFVMMGRYPYLGPFASPTAADDEAVDQAMQQTGVMSLALRDLATLSGGELQKVYIAAGIAQGGKIILLDEPATFLDPGHQHDIFGILQKLNQQGITVITVTHDINTAVLTGSRIIAMCAGRIVFDGNPEDIMHNDVLEPIYGHAFKFTDHPETGNRIVIPEVYLNEPAAGDTV